MSYEGAGIIVGKAQSIPEPATVMLVKFQRSRIWLETLDFAVEIHNLSQSGQYFAAILAGELAWKRSPEQSERSHNAVQ